MKSSDSEIERDNYFYDNVKNHLQKYDGQVVSLTRLLDGIQDEIIRSRLAAELSSPTLSGLAFEGGYLKRIDGDRWNVDIHKFDPEAFNRSMERFVELSPYNWGDTMNLAHQDIIDVLTKAGDQAFDEEMIREGIFKPGEKLPTELSPETVKRAHTRIMEKYGHSCTLNVENLLVILEIIDKEWEKQLVAEVKAESSKEESLKDLLTRNNVFGLFKYVPPEHGLAPFEKVKKLFQFPNKTGGIVETQYSFWHWLHKDGCEEPDILITCTVGDGSQCLLLIESKYLSGKSLLADDT